MDGGFGQTALLIFIMVAILFGAYYATKFLANRGKRMTRSKYIKVIDQIAVANDKQIALIDVDGEKILIGITSQNINMISKINSDRIDVEVAQEKDDFSRPAFFSKIGDFIKKTRQSPYELQKARQEERKKRQANKRASKNEDESFDKILKSIDERKKQFDSYRKDENDEN